MQTVETGAESTAAPTAEAFGARTGVPILVNTSLNDRTEPIVEALADALCAFLRTCVDARALEHRLVVPAER